jgi:1-acyl-sn-glycerol-3-phosphate acyltransferase
VNPLVYWPVRAAFQPAFHFGLSMRRLHRERIPAVGPVILASNHRSFLDPFLIACLVRRPVYFVAKRELFRIRPIAWILGALGAFPIVRGHGDGEAMATALAILERGDIVVIAVIGTEDVRRGVVFRPRPVTLSCGAPLRFPRVADPSPQLAGAITDRIWPNVEREWVAVGGAPGVLAATAGEDVLPAGVRAA